MFKLPGKTGGFSHSGLLLVGRFPSILHVGKRTLSAHHSRSISTKNMELSAQNYLRSMRDGRPACAELPTFYGRMTALFAT